MGQRADSNRNAALDDQKSRAAGRRGRTGQNKAGQGQIRDAVAALPAKGQTGGAFGKAGKAERSTHSHTGGGGGGGGAQSQAKAAHINIPAGRRKGSSAKT